MQDRKPFPPSPKPIMRHAAQCSPVAQLKTCAPPVYRPTPNTAQAKVQAKKSSAPSVIAGAPPAYKPTSFAGPPPPVYRPNVNTKSVLPKTAQQSGAPPVYRPSAAPAHTQPTSARPGARPFNQSGKAAAGGFAPPVYRPVQPASIHRSVTPDRVPFSGRHGKDAGPLQPKAFPKQQIAFTGSQSRQIAPSISRSTTVQRLVILVSRDAIADQNYQNLINIDQTTDMTNSLREGNGNLPGKPLDQLGPNEALHIVSHGDGQGHIEGQDDDGSQVQMGAGEFLSFLIKNGFKKKHKGPIRLLSCFSGTRTSSGTTFAEEFTIVLRNRGFDNPVIAFDGLVGVKPGAHIGVVAPSKVKEFDMLRNVAATLDQQFETLKSAPPSESNLKRMREILDLKKQRIDESNNLFEQQRRGDNANIVYFPTSPVSQGGPSELSKQRAAREWEEWHQRQLKNFNMLDTGPSSTPSYIS